MSNKKNDTLLYPAQSLILKECIQKENGVLCLPMGAGKTLISLYYIRAIKIKIKKIIEKDENYTSNNLGLVVCSKSLIGEWESEIIKHFKEFPMKYEIYHKDYIKNLDKFNPKDDTEVIITTYDTVRSEYKKDHNIKDNFIRKTNTLPPETYYRCPMVGEVYGDSFLFGDQFNITFFDEVQDVSNISTDKNRGCCCISSIYKWGLSGTPIKEPKPANIFGLYTLCKLPFTDKLSNAKDYLEKRKRGDGHMKYFVSRQIEDLEEYIKLPSKSIFVEKHQTNKEEKLFVKTFQDLYTYYYNMAQKENDSKKKNFFITSYFAILIYLRQACISSLIAYESIVNNYNIKNKKLTLSAKNRTKSPKVEEEKGEEEDEEEDEIKEELKKEEKNIKIDKEYVHKEILDNMNKKIEEHNLKEYFNNKENHLSSRFKVVLFLLKKHLEDKVVLVSTSRAALVKIKDIINEKLPDMNTYHLDSNLDIKERNDMLKSFRENEKSDVLLFTYKLGSAGLNLQEANVIILLDFWWNKEESEQAISRIYRQGQKRKVFIYLLTADTGIEYFLFEKHKEKKHIIDLQMAGGYKIKKTKNVPISKIIYDTININRNEDLIKNNFNLIKKR